MGHVVNSKNHQVDHQQRQLGGAVDGGYEGEEDVDGEGEEEDPGDDLLRVKGELESMDPPPFPELLPSWGGVTVTQRHHRSYSSKPLIVMIYQAV